MVGKKERGLSSMPDDPEALNREYAVENEGDAPDIDADDVMNKTQYQSRNIRKNRNIQENI